MWKILLKISVFSQLLIKQSLFKINFVLSYHCFILPQWKFHPLALCIIVFNCFYILRQFYDHNSIEQMKISCHICSLINMPHLIGKNLQTGEPACHIRSFKVHTLRFIQFIPPFLPNWESHWSFYCVHSSFFRGYHIVEIIHYIAFSLASFT